MQCFHYGLLLQKKLEFKLFVQNWLEKGLYLPNKVCFLLFPFKLPDIELKPCYRLLNHINHENPTRFRIGGCNSENKMKTTYTSDSERQHSGTLASLTFIEYSILTYVMQG